MQPRRQQHRDVAFGPGGPQSARLPSQGRDLAPAPWPWLDSAQDARDGTSPASSTTCSATTATCSGPRPRAARQNWTDALKALERGERARSYAAHGMRDSLGDGATVDTLDQLLRATPATTTALARAVRLPARRRRPVRRDVRHAQQAARGRAIGAAQRAAASSRSSSARRRARDITDALVDIERARGDINAALDATPDRSQ